MISINIIFDDVLLVSAKPSVTRLKRIYTNNIQIYQLSGVVGSIIDGDPMTAAVRNNNEIHEIHFRPICGETNRRRRRPTLQYNNNNIHSSRSNRTESYIIFCSLNERRTHTVILLLLLLFCIFITAPIRVTAAAALVRSKLETVYKRKY